MPIRNPFKRGAGETESSEDVRALSRNGSDTSFQQTKVTGSRPVEIKEPVEYKLSEINDSGVYLPPSPTEKKSFWHSRTSTSSSNYRSMLNDNEPFNISRESFDSYRRSFDISARSPVLESDPHMRQSLDSRRTRLPRLSMEQRIDRPEGTVEEGFEEVGLNDDAKPKKRSLFSRFNNDTSNDTHGTHTDSSKASSGHLGFHLTGRKRGHSGKGEELRSMPSPTATKPHIPEVSV